MSASRSSGRVRRAWRAPTISPTYGYRPVVFEAQDRPGGMMVLGIPPYRLRRDVLQDEIRAILDMGVELRTGQAPRTRLLARLAQG